VREIVMRQKIITLICTVFCMVLFASAIYVESDIAWIQPITIPTSVQWAVLMTDQQRPTPTFEPDAPESNYRDFTQEEITMLAKVLYAESNVLEWYGTRYGVSYTARQAAVAWCALNRLDAGTFEDSLKEVLTAPNQFAYKEDSPVTEHMLWLAEDVAARWNQEHKGDEEVGRTLPSDYLYFEGDGKENYFRKEYQGISDVWDWSLPDPYGGDQ